MPAGSYRKDGREAGRTFVILCVVSVLLFTFSCRENGTGVLTSTRGVFSAITLPVRYLGAAVSAPFQGLGNVFSNLTASQETLTQLKEENADLTSQNAQLKESELTAERLEALLQLKSTYNLQSTAARVVAGSSDSWTSTVTIDKGTSSGLSVGMPVMNSSGVIGQIMQCGPSTSVVRLVTDENSGISAMLQTSRAQGELVGSADGTVKLTLIAVEKTVSVGDVVITSGLGGVYPKGLPLGTVTSVSKSSSLLYYDITVKTYATAENNEEVIVITSLTEDQKATTSDMASADSQDSAPQATTITTVEAAASAAAATTVATTGSAQ